MTRTTPARRTRLAAAALTLPLVALLAACASGAEADAEAGSDLEAAAEAAGLEVDTSPEQDRIRTTESAEAIALLPAAYRDTETLTVAVSAYVAPLAFLADDEKTPIGNETDIAQLVADALGKDLELEVKAWADWPLALQSGDVDAVISNVTVTEERKELYDFSSYRTDELGWLVKTGNEEITEIDEPADVAGLTVAVGSGTNQEKILLAWDEENQAAGLDPVTIEYFENDGDTILALQSGRIDVSFGPNATAAYKAKVSPQDFTVVGTLNGGWPATAQIAAATLKGNDLAPAFTAALNHAIEDGTYTEVLERWGLEGEAIATSETNPAGLPKTS
ncbi:ABC transporter substrate-binding protein [Cellulomonas cellasea]|uniref:Polar amino acid transport system substrate-binding protein n=1 Tax=Cellulomonas cellasea TaxID=43670 RepID=A0A7W4UDB8_9CELL|nr:ABC transporter substrate-binding protein [Cellulomonas cellasea]MBB2921453.1 polar amino acid transport system substrate-binding protein [Cellulomonas cellasea]